MKTLAPLFLAAITFGCAHDAIEQPITPYHASAPATSFSTDAPIALAQKNYTNGLVNEAFAGLQSAYEESQDIKYLEYSVNLTGQEIQRMEEQIKDKTILLHDVTNVLAGFYDNNKIKCDENTNAVATILQELPYFQTPVALYEEKAYLKAKKESHGLQKIKAEYAYKALRDDNIDKYSREIFMPRIEETKNAMLRIQPIISSRISIPSPDYNRLLALNRQINKQRETICELRIQYLSNIFIGPRVNLGDKLVYMARCDRPNIFGKSPMDLNSYWIDKLALLFTKDYGDWVAQSDEQTRLQFAALARNCKNALGEARYKDFQTILDLLSNNKEGGSDLWWPAESSSE